MQRARRTTRSPRHPATPPLRGLRIGMIGCGTMGQALLAGLRARGMAASSLLGADASRETLARARRRFGLRTVSAAEVARRADVVVLAVKPQQLPAVVAEIAPHLPRRTLVISIAAGVTLRWLAHRLPGAALVRAMPNVPATVGCGFAALAVGRSVSAGQRAAARALFEAVGVAAMLPERRLDAVTAVSGSGPAYVFFLVEAWEAAARGLGLPRAVAARAIRATLLGSARLLEAGELPAEELVRRVASKRGTTEAALTVLARRRARQHVIEAIRAAARRARALAWS